ncbi:IS630 family transposase [Streptomyces sp. MST-110588]|uniref:IS630 family transposase n=1 Tax=Streptomyces sp. MST-110588 TaxID=2833628 RepID=UPI001F5DC189|nr:IS630 family transposase [Streptomyces sp. MST-110588]UNO40792.1 IS630 family transposase [Streptomyces sp. MST-110588]
MNRPADARRLPPAAQEAVRLRVVAALESGRARTYRQAAGMFGVSERSVGTWWRKHRALGRAALAAPAGSRTGAREAIGAADRALLCRIMADHTPEELLNGTPLWTRGQVAELFRVVLGVVMTEQGVGKWLHRHGVITPRADRRTHEREGGEAAVWFRREYPALAARAKAERAVVVWTDRYGLRADRSAYVRTGEPGDRALKAGQEGRPARLNVLCAVAPRGALWFMVYEGRLTAEVFTTFLDRLARQAGRKVHVITGRHPVHRSQAVRTWLAGNEDRAEVHGVPGSGRGRADSPGGANSAAPAVISGSGGADG